MLKRIINRLLPRSTQQDRPEPSYRAPVSIPGGNERIYHVHIRKTAGSSINHAFMAASGGDDQKIYDDIIAAPDHLVECNGFVYQGWEFEKIQAGNYFFAFSHNPFWGLNLPPKTFTITCFRDPIKRVLSHYKMLKHYEESKIDHPCMKTEGAWMGSSLEDFAHNIPGDRLLNQLFMFSEALDIQEALNSCQKIDRILFTENLQENLDDLGKYLGLTLPTQHRKKTSDRPFPDQAIETLRERLDPEYRFLEMLKQNQQAAI
ncbi:MAG: hypothetical protein AAFX93_05425 [Verrucomicrobiota bacterium]